MKLSKVYRANGEERERERDGNVWKRASGTVNDGMNKPLGFGRSIDQGSFKWLNDC